MIDQLGYILFTSLWMFGLAFLVVGGLELIKNLFCALIDKLIG